MPNTTAALVPPLLLAAGLSACVTINIYFPEAAAEKAADKIINDVWQLKGGQAPARPTTPGEAPGQPAGEASGTPAGDASTPPAGKEP